MYIKVTNKTPLNFITLNDAKRQLNIVDDTTDNIHISDLIKAAMELSEIATHRKLSPCTVNLVVRACSTIRVPFGDVETITSVTTVDAAPVNYTFNEITQQITITDTSILSDDELMIVYDVGYDDPNKVPHAIKMGAKILISDFYENRESTVVGASVADIPLGAKALFDSQKLDYL